MQVFYDPLIAKLIVHGSSRTEALRILRKALGEYQIVGPHTNIEFLKRLAAHESFISGDVETGFIPVSLPPFNDWRPTDHILGPQKHYDALFAPAPSASAATLAQAGLFVALRELAPTVTSSSDPWASVALAGFRVGGVDSFQRSIEFNEGGENGRKATVSVGAPSAGAYNVTVVDFEGQSTSFPSLSPSSHAPTIGSTSLSTLLENKLSSIDIVSEPSKSATGGEKLSLFDVGEEFVGSVEVGVEEWLVELKGAVAGAVGSARAPMREFLISDV